MYYKEILSQIPYIILSIQGHAVDILQPEPAMDTNSGPLELTS